MYFNVTPALLGNPLFMEFENKLLQGYSPIAYNIMVHHQPVIFEVFLAAYFRPYDYYVVHLDAKVFFKNNK